MIAEGVFLCFALALPAKEFRAPLVQEKGNIVHMAKENGVVWTAGYVPKHISPIHDDAKLFRILLEPVRRHENREPAVLFAYNYYDMANYFRRYGMRAYSMTITLSGGHLRGHLLDLPFMPGSLGAVVLLQKVAYAELFEALDPVAVGGVFLIEERNIPYLADAVIQGMGFLKTHMTWHDFTIYRRMERKAYKDGGGFDVFNAKKVQSKYLFHRMIEASA